MAGRKGRVRTPQLPELLEEITKWCGESEFPYGVYISWTNAQLQILVNYFSQVDVDSTFSSQMYRKLRVNEAWQDKGGFNPQICRRATQLVLSFLQDLGELFKVPNLQQLSHMDNTLNKNQLVAGFISFLLQLLHPDPYFFALYAFPVVKTRLVKELRFLVTILGDTPFQAVDHVEVQNILTEFEQVANEAGILLHSVMFIPDVAVKTMNEAISAHLEHIELLNASIHDLGDLISRDDKPLVEVEDQIKLLHQWLIACLALLHVPQPIQIEELKKEPIVQLITVAYDAEYLINSFLVEDVPLRYLAIRLTHHIGNIKLIEDRLQEPKTDCDIEVTKVAGKLSTHLSLQTNKDSGVDDIVVGFEEWERNILDQLVGGTKHLQNILIFGMSGLGKTTLARKLYHHPYVNYHFHKQSWCVVSQVYQKKNLLIDILISLKSEFDRTTMLGKDEDEESLARHVYQSLKGWRYLIVVDDLWNSNVWDDLRRIFPNDSNGSRILFTSRNKCVAPPGSIICELPFFSEDLCWELLEKKVFCNKPCPPNLQCIGKKIATKCYGLPLVVVVTAGILSTLGMEENSWTLVDENLESFVHSDQNEFVMQILELSYIHLPPHLKPCFLSFGVFPEDEQISTKKLKLWWIAEGFIYEEKGAESLGEKYLMELIDRSLVIVSETRSNGGAKFCVMHDLLRDLCVRIAEKEYFLKLLNCNSSIWYQKSHRLCIKLNPSDQSSSFLVPYYNPRIRSFIALGGETSLSVLNLKSLRSFGWTGSSNHDVFGIELLAHLRFLVIRRMVPSIQCLTNLEFLSVGGRAHISSKVLQMVKLRYLIAEELSFDQTSFLSHGGENNLEHLAVVQICGQKDMEILKYSPRLHTLKCGCFQRPSLCLDFNFLTQLESLTLQFDRRMNYNISEFPASIKKLTLSKAILSSKQMEMMGKLPNLEVLKLYVIKFEEDRWDTRDGKFEKLRLLRLEGIFALRQWNISSSEHFPKLRRLELSYCRYLIEIPSEIGEIATLESIDVNGRHQESMAESAYQIQQQQQDLGNQEFKLMFHSTTRLRLRRLCTNTRRLPRVG